MTLAASLAAAGQSCRRVLCRFTANMAACFLLTWQHLLVAALTRLAVLVLLHTWPQVTETSSWSEGPTPVYQLDVKVTNTSPAPASSMKLRVAAAGELQKCWNATQLPDEEGAWCFDLPDWCAQSGGLAVGANVAVGLIVKGEKPTQFSLQ